MNRSGRWTVAVVVVCSLELLVAALFGGAIVAAALQPSVLVPIVVAAGLAIVARRRLRPTHA